MSNTNEATFAREINDKRGALTTAVYDKLLATASGPDSSDLLSLAEAATILKLHGFLKLPKRARDLPHDPPADDTVPADGDDAPAPYNPFI